MNRIILPVLFAQLLLAPASVAAGPTAAQKSAICETRSTCTIGTAFNGMPSAQRWLTHDAAGHPVVVLRLTWPNDHQLLSGTAIVYSQAEAGRQARLVATTGIVKNHPLYVPAVVSLPNGNVEPRPGGCRIHDGRLSMDVGAASQ
jgi:hypothetical protein